MLYENIPPGHLIMTPADPMFDWILNTSPPPGWKKQVDSDFQGFFVVRADTGIMEPALTPQAYNDYCFGGELDERPDPLAEDDRFEISYL